MVYCCQWLGTDSIICGGHNHNMARVIDRGTLNVSVQNHVYTGFDTNPSPSVWDRLISRWTSCIQSCFFCGPIEFVIGLFITVYSSQMLILMSLSPAAEFTEIIMNTCQFFCCYNWILWALLKKRDFFDKATCLLDHLFILI